MKNIAVPSTPAWSAVVIVGSAAFGSIPCQISPVTASWLIANPASSFIIPPLGFYLFIERRLRICFVLESIKPFIVFIPNDCAAGKTPDEIDQRL
jgi:hypothetical protein